MKPLTDILFPNWQSIDLRCAEDEYQEAQKRNHNRIVCVLLDILRCKQDSDKGFFNNKSLDAFKKSFNSYGDSKYDIESFLSIAEIFLLAESGSFEEVITKVKDSNWLLQERIRNTYVNSPLLEQIDYIDSSFEKSLIGIFLENTDHHFTELVSMGFDICDIGERFREDHIPRERNHLLLWYMLLKRLILMSPKFVYILTKFPSIMNGPAIFGALIKSVTQKVPDTEFLKKIRHYFQDQWFINAKYNRQTAYEYFLR